MAEFTDEELIRNCCQGDSDAWTALVERYQRLIYSIPRRAGFDEETASDVLQQTFLKLLQNIEKINQPSQIQAWLVTTAKRETLHLLRGTKKTVSIDGDEENEGYDVVSLDPLTDDVLVEMEKQHLVKAAVAKLGDKCRELLTMLFYQTEQIAYSEIARILGISEGSIGPTRARCLEKLKDGLKSRV